MVYGAWWVFDTDTFPSLLTLPHHGGNMLGNRHDHEDYDGFLFSHLALASQLMLIMMKVFLIFL